MFQKFEGKIFCLDLANSTSYKEKKSLIDLITSNGGVVTLILNRKVDYLLKNDAKNVDTYKCKTAFKLGKVVLKTSYITELILKPELKLKISDYVIKNKKSVDDLNKGLIPKNDVEKTAMKKFIDMKNVNFFQVKDDKFINDFEINGYDIAKWIVFHEKSGKCSFIIELQLSKNDSIKNKFRMRTETFNKIKGASQLIQHTYSEDSSTIYLIYKEYINQYLNDKLYEYNMRLPNFSCGSQMLKTIAWKSAINKSLDLKDDVKSFVNYIWQEAIGDIEDLFEIKANQSQFKDLFSIDKLNKAECVLEKQREELKTASKPVDFSHEFYNILPFKQSKKRPIADKRVLYELFETCQCLRDMLNISESTNWDLRTSSESQYRSIGAYIHNLDAKSLDYANVKNNLLKSIDTEINVLNIYEIVRPSESFNFMNTMDNIKQLYHGSKVNNFLGILTRGLMLPKHVISEFGDIRSDIGMLGSGIYFSDSLATSLKYSKTSRSKNTRLVAVCDVALGNCKDYYDFDTTLSSAPDGYDSTHGARNSDSSPSKFIDSEYAVYDTKQYRIRYIVELNENRDGSVKNFQLINDNDQEMKEEDQNDDCKVIKDDKLDLDRLEKGKNSIEKVNSGLMTNSDTRLPLKSVHIRAQLIDMISKVVIFQEYLNEENHPIEAKYVFPLDDSAAVCGFEAFINDKHVIGVCKEKEEAHRKYKEAIQAGHGAYLMDQETPDLFTINVGNLPANCRCIIKITYVAELSVQNEQIVFKLPSNLASWQTIDIEKEKRQETVLTKFISKLTNQNTSFMASILMPFEIRSIHSPTHNLKIKKTSCHAVCELNTQNMSSQSLSETLLLLVDMSAIHIPRMLIEDHPSSDSRACMVSFYPEFETKLDEMPSLLFMLDCSNSMRSSFTHAKKLLLLMLKNLPNKCLFNVILFGSDYVELFPIEMKNTPANYKKAVDFITNAHSNKGNTDLFSVLEPYLKLNLENEIKNFVLISDGHLSRSNELLAALNDSNAGEKKSINRLFSCSIGDSANNHLLKLISTITGGSYEGFDVKYQSKWLDKLNEIMDKCIQPAAVKNIKIEWQNYDSKSIQAPAKINALFNGRRVVAYGFISNCFNATLKAEINGVEVSTVVSCPELCITKGTILHKLTAKALIDDWQYGILCDNDQVKNDLLRSKLKENIIKLSQEHNITSQYTSFLAIEDRTEQEKRKIYSKLEDSTTPSIDLLLDKDEDTCQIDILPYVGYYEQVNDLDKELNDLFDLLNSDDKQKLYEFLAENKSSTDDKNMNIKAKFCLSLTEELEKEKKYEECIDLCNIYSNQSKLDKQLADKLKTQAKKCSELNEIAFLMMDQEENEFEINGDMYCSVSDDSDDNVSFSDECEEVRHYSSRSRSRDRCREKEEEEEEKEEEEEEEMDSSDDSCRFSEAEEVDELCLASSPKKESRHLYNLEENKKIKLFNALPIYEESNRSIEGSSSNFKPQKSRISIEKTRIRDIYESETSDKFLEINKIYNEELTERQTHQVKSNKIELDSLMESQHVNIETKKSDELRFSDMRREKLQLFSENQLKLPEPAQNFEQKKMPGFGGIGFGSVRPQQVYSSSFGAGLFSSPQVYSSNAKSGLLEFDSTPQLQLNNASFSFQSGKKHSFPLVDSIKPHHSITKSNNEMGFSDMPAREENQIQFGVCQSTPSSSSSSFGAGLFSSPPVGANSSTQTKTASFSFGAVPSSSSPQSGPINFSNDQFQRLVLPSPSINLANKMVNQSARVQSLGHSSYFHSHDPHPVMNCSSFSNQAINRPFIMNQAKPKQQQHQQQQFQQQSLKSTIIQPNCVVFNSAHGVSNEIKKHSFKCADLLLLDVLPLSLGIETACGIMSKVLKRNTTIPTSTSIIFTTYFDYQTDVLIKIYEGERLFSKHNNLLGTLKLENIPALPRGVAQIKVKFDIDANGILSVSAELLDANESNRVEIRITNDKGRLSRDDIEKMIVDCEKNKENDDRELNLLQDKILQESHFFEKRIPIEDDKREGYNDDIEKSIKQKVSRWDKVNAINNHNEMKGFIKNQLEIQFMNNANLNENNFADFFRKLSDKNKLNELDLTDFNIFNLNFEPLLNYLDKSGIKSLGPKSEKQIKVMTVLFWILYFNLKFLSRVQPLLFMKLDEFQTSLENTFKFIYSKEILSGISNSVIFIKEITNQHSLLPFNLELSKNWEQFLFFN